MRVVIGVGLLAVVVAGWLFLQAPPVAADYVSAREEMVRHVRAGGVTDDRVLAAMGRVPRHEFVPESVRAQAYANRPLDIGRGQTISQPQVVAIMTAAV